MRIAPNGVSGLIGSVIVRHWREAGFDGWFELWMTLVRPDSTMRPDGAGEG